MNSNFEIEEDFEFSDDDSFGCCFFEPARDANFEDESSGKNKNETKAIYSPRTPSGVTSKCPDNNLPVMDSSCRKKDVDQLFDNTLTLSQTLLGNEFLQKGLKRKIDLENSKPKYFEKAPSFMDKAESNLNFEDDIDLDSLDDSFDIDALDTAQNNLENLNQHTNPSRVNTQQLSSQINSHKHTDSITSKDSNEDALIKVNKTEKCVSQCQDNEDDLQFIPVEKRKFPGPAGWLPNLNSVTDITNTTLFSPLAKKTLARTPQAALSPAILDLRHDEDFKKPLWLRLQKEAQTTCKGITNHTVSTILRRARQNQLEKGKVPLFYSLIKTFSVSGSDASIVLKDPTGEIHGTVHKRVLEEYQFELCPGSGLILKQVSIFSPNAKKHYVNITPSNIVVLLPAEQISPTQSSQSRGRGRGTQMPDV
eukprot:gene3325-3812_t